MSTRSAPGWTGRAGLTPGATSGYAQEMAWSGTDIWSDVTYANGDKVTMWAKNPEVGYPMIGFGTGWGEHQGYDVGESAQWNYAGTTTITRTDDGGYWKTFDIERPGDRSRDEDPATCRVLDVRHGGMLPSVC